MKYAAATLVGAAVIVCAALWFWPTSDERETPASKPDGGEPMFVNALINQTSPYLLQHAHNPVNWMPWGDEAFEKAKAQGKPIFLSVGYSTCHWCHVMAHESFEDEGVAEILNEHFVSIKVDREELPDVDAQYMLASQLITQQGGGWPNSVWLTPAGQPWFAGTYFPREDRGRQAGFKTILLHLAEVWRTRRAEVEKQAQQVAEAIRGVGSGQMEQQDERPLGWDLIDNAEKVLVSRYDERHGGFGERPKFPPHGTLALLIARERKTSQPQRLEMIVRTLEAMSRGGIYDHVGGGFHRYATDERWLLPHFEKMLYDNAQLIGIYADAYDLSGRASFRRVIAETFAWLTREMTDPAGGFYSALDADSLNEQGHAEEGKFYVWTPEQIIDTLGETDGRLFIDVYGITAEGNFRDEASGERTGDSIAYLAGSLAEMAEGLRIDGAQIDEEQLRRRLEAMRGKLLLEREKRSRPGLDDKVLVGWNGLMIAGLARAGRVLDEPQYIAAAERAADFILENLRDADGRLLRTWRQGKAKLPAYLNDYAFFIQGLLELHRATGQDSRLLQAGALAERMVEDFGNSATGGFYLTSAQHETLLFRGTGLGGGGNIPSGGGVAAETLARLAALTKNPDYADTAAKTFAAQKSTMWRQPYQAEHYILALGEYLHLAEQGSLPPLTDARPSTDQITEALPEEADATDGEPPVSVRAFASRDRVKPGDLLSVAVQIEIDEPWHIYSNRPGSEIPIKTQLSLESEHAVLESVDYPPSAAIQDPSGGETLNTYSGKVTLVAAIRIDFAAKKPATKGPVTLPLMLRAQACDNKQCLQAKTYRLPIEVSVLSDAAQGGHAPVLRYPWIFKPLGVK